MIAEPWDVGMGGWQTGNFGDGWHEWNDRYRDRVRNFWLSDVDYARRASTAPVGIGGFATRLAGSSNTFSAERGPLASVNFVTAHDGFTLRDLVSYDVKHNVGNGEQNRDGADTNRSFNHGAEGPTDDEGILATRRKAMRNLLGTLLLSAGVPDAHRGRRVRPHSARQQQRLLPRLALTWLSWDHAPWQQDLCAHVRAAHRSCARENPALRPSRFAQLGEHTPSASVMEWYDQNGETMSIDAVDRPRTPHAAVRRGVHSGERGVQPDPADRARQRAPDRRHAPRRIEGVDARSSRSGRARTNAPTDGGRRIRCPATSCRSPAPRCVCSAPSDAAATRSGAPSAVPRRGAR